jgi:hypothetical protein
MCMGLSCFVVLSLVVAMPAQEGVDTMALAVLEAGRPPRRALRVTPPVGRELHARLEVDTEWDVGTDAAPRTEYGPEVAVPLTVSLDAVPGREHASYILQAGRPEVHASGGDGGQEAAWALATQLAPLSDSRVGFVLSNTGLPVAVDVPSESGEARAWEALLRETLNSGWFATPQFPEQPVGVGARWTVARALAPGGFIIVTYELVELRGTRGRVRFQIQTRGAEPLPEPQVQGELCFDLRTPLPESFELRSTVREPGAGGIEVERRTHVRLVATAPEPRMRPEPGPVR